VRFGLDGAPRRAPATAKTNPEGRQAAKIVCCSAFSVAGDLRLRLDETGLERSNHEAAVTAVGVGHTSAGASHNRLCCCAACSCQTGHHPLGLGLSEAR
jgi:hypothetical protein